jgi:hypothetical protein
MQPERPRARRYPFVANIELTDLESETQIRKQTSDLTLFGCSVDAEKPLPKGTRVRIRIVHGGANFRALGRVVYSQQKVGMGVAFTKIEPTQESVLENWIAGLRETRANTAA